MKLLKQARTQSQERRFADAILSYQQLLEKEMPVQSKCEALYEQALCHCELQQHREAAKVLLRVIQMLPNNYMALNQLGVCFNNLDRHSLAISYFQKTMDCMQALGMMQLTANQGNIRLCFQNLAHCHIKLKDFEEAIRCYEQSLALQPTDIQTLLCLADLHFYLKQYDTSLRMFDRIPNLLELPDFAYKKSFVLLALRRYAEGFALYECRLNNNHCPVTNKPARVDIPFLPYWTGEGICERLLVVYEQGIGDNILFFRFVIDLAARYPDMRIDYFCKPVVSQLFVCPNNVHIASEVVPGMHDARVYIMSLPSVLGLTDLQPCPHQYLRRDAALAEVWAERIAHEIGTITTNHPRKRIGFAVQGLLTQAYIDKFLPWDKFRTELLEVCASDRWWWVCLQKTDELKWDQQAPAHVWFPPDLDATQPFADTVELIYQMDLIITVDTALAHLAGIAGVPTLLLLGRGTDWRWFDDTTKCTLYANVQILRSPQRDFASVLPLAKAWLEEWSANS